MKRRDVLGRSIAIRALACSTAICLGTGLVGCNSKPEMQPESAAYVQAQTQTADSASESAGSSDAKEAEQTNGQTTQITVSANGNELRANLEDNPSAQALAELLTNGPLTIAMHDYGNMEKVGPIGQSLPTSDAQITAEPGDIILYQGNQLTIYYDVNSWSFTRVGRIEGVSATELKDILGNGDVEVAFSLA